MINIRTITYNLPKNFNNNELKLMGCCINDWNNYKYFVRTQRISTTPIKNISLLNKYDKLNNFCDKFNIRWFNIPVILNNKNRDELLDFSYEILKKYDKAFINIDGVKDGIMYFDSIDDYIKLMKRVGKLSPNGKDNFRLGLSINVKDDTPFFPFARSSGEFNFTIGLELTQEINRIIDNNKNENFESLRKIIIKTIDKQISQIEKQAKIIEEQYNITFKGFDFSLAPIMEEGGSIMELIEKLGIKNFGGSGIMFVTSYLTNILKTFGNTHKHIGFSGVMYSLLEDSKLCEINNDNPVRLEDLIKLSTMCGCGIDMIPIKDNLNNEILKSYILDIAAISCRLNKPLGVRFLSIPNVQVFTDFNEDADFITNTKVLDIDENKLICDDMKEFKFININ